MMQERRQRLRTILKYEGHLYRLEQLIIRRIKPTKIFKVTREGVRREDVLGEYIVYIIIIPDDDIITFKEIDSILEPLISDNKMLQYTLYKEGVLAQGNVFCTLNCNRQNLIYEDYKYVKFTREWLIGPVVSKEDLQQAKKLANGRFYNLFDSALSYYKCAKFLRRKNKVDKAIPYLLCQTILLVIESVTKSVMGKNIGFANIGYAKKIARAGVPELNVIFSNNTEEEERIGKMLNVAYRYARYKEWYKVEYTDQLLVFRSVKRLLVTCKEVVKGVTE